MIARFGRSFSSELRKMTATKMWWIMALALFLYAAMMAGIFAALFGTMADIGAEMGAEMGAESGADPEELPFPAAEMIYSGAASFGYAIPLLFGAVMATTELRHKVLGLAFIAEPKREIVLAAKIVTLLVIGVIIGVAGLIGSVGVGGTVFAMLGGDTNLGSLDTWVLIARTLAAIALWAVIGFGLGLLMRNQALAIVIALVFTQFLEPMLRTGAMFWEWSASIARFFPGAATDAFIGVSLLGDMSAFDPEAPSNSDALNIWQGGLVLLAIAVAVVFIGWAVRWRRDIES